MPMKKTIQVVLLKAMLSLEPPRRLLLRRTPRTPDSHAGVAGFEVSRRHPEQAVFLLAALGQARLNLLRN